MNYTPGSAPKRPDDLPSYLTRELQRIAASATEDAQRLMFISAILTPAQLTGSVNDYAPTGLNRATWVRLDASTPLNITGLKNTTAGKPRWLFLSNISANTITLVNASASSAAANRFALPGAANLAITRNMGVILIYDISSAVWRSLS